jgi:ribose transport system permease protein
MNPLVATLGSSLVISGLAVVLTNGMLVTVTQTSFSSLGQGTVFTIKYSIIMWGVFALACGILLSRTVFGRFIYASGGNALAARLSGVRVGVIRTAAYAISGLSAGMAGVLVASRVSTGEADVGTTLPLTVIAAIVIGGTSILGGEGAIWRTILGVLLLALIGNGFDLLGVNPIYQQILQGGIILTAVGIDAWARVTSD